MQLHPANTRFRAFRFTLHSEIILYRFVGGVLPCSTNSTPATDEDVTLTKRTSVGGTQHHVLCAADTCPVTLTTPCGDARGRVARKRAFEGFVMDLYPCHVYLASPQLYLT